MTKRRMLVTGGSGYVGGWVARLATPQYDVTATYASNPMSTVGINWRWLDVRDQTAVDDLVREVSPQLIVHTAAVNPGQGEDFSTVNVAGTRHVAEAAASCGARLIHFSTDLVFDGRRGNYREDDPTNPLTPYAKTKAAAERAVADAGPEAVIVRTSLVYGWRPTVARSAQWMIDDVMAGRELNLWSDEMRCPIWVESLAAAVVELAGLNHTGALHIAGSQVVSRYEFGTRLLRFHGVDTARVHPVASPPDNQRPLDCTLDTSLARRILSTPLPGVDEVLGAGVNPPP
jgi:dTDP-4-dehydrorhamnose reductase